MRYWLAGWLVLLAGVACAEPVRVATFNTALSQRGPGVLLDKIIKAKDRKIITVARIIKTVRPDILLINELDHDYENRTLRAFLALLAQDDGEYQGITYPYFFAPPQNTGVPSGVDLNGDGKVGGPEDSFGYGKFRGQYAMALVSRFPVLGDQAKDFSTLKWAGLAFAPMPSYPDGKPFPSGRAQAVMRFSSKGHWVVPVKLPDGRVLSVLASHPTPPVFDGPEDMNGLRNAAEIGFWRWFVAQPDAPADYVLLGDMNSDPLDGDSRHGAIADLLSSPYFEDPQPRSTGAVAAARAQGGANLHHKGDPALDTADFRDTPAPGNLRVDYVLPAPGLRVLASGVFWPAPNEAGGDLIGSGGRAGSDHRLVWVDLE